MADLLQVDKIMKEEEKVGLEEEGIMVMLV